MAAPAKGNPGTAAAARHDADAEAPGLGMLEEGVAFYLRIAQDASFRSFARRTGQLDIRPGCFAAMEVLDNNPGITASALGRAIARDKSTVTPLIQYLQRRGLVDRTPSEADRRRIHLRLTPAGKDMLQDLEKHAAAHDAEMDAIVGGAKGRIIALLKDIADALNR